MPCIHGQFLDDACPICLQEKRIKPAVLLREPTPTELPIKLPPESFTEEKNIKQSEFITRNQPFTSMPQMPVRSFNLRDRFFAPEDSLLNQRLKALEQNEKFNAINSDVPLVDLKKKFLQK
jgi:hypothetical protein